MSELYDVVVVGGGPAGSAAALRARQLNPDAGVLLLDAAEFPRDKACGDGIAPHAVDELSGLGVADAIAGYPPIRRLRVGSPGGAEVVSAPARPNYVVPRKVFDARLVAAAAAAGVEVRRHRVHRLAVRRAWVELDAAVAGRVVIGADGANSTVRRQAGVVRSPAKQTAIAVRGYAPAPAGTPEQRIAMVAQGLPAYAWSFPIGDGTANVGFGKLVTRVGEEGRSGRAELYDRLSELLPDSPADPATLRAHHLPLSSGRPRQPDGRVLLAGDALSLINPLTGEGIYYALLSGRLAAEAAVAAPAMAGTAYLRALGRELGRHLRHTAALARAGQLPGFLDAAVTAAGRRHEVFDLVVEIGLGRGTVLVGMLATVARGWVGSRLIRAAADAPGRGTTIRLRVLSLLLRGADSMRGRILLVIAVLFAVGLAANYSFADRSPEIIEGTLDGSPTCLLIKTSIGLRQIELPESYTALSSPLRILDKHRREVGRDGDRFRVGGDRATGPRLDCQNTMVPALSTRSIARIK